MKNYGGIENDRIDSDVSWIREHGYCHEMFNFRPDNGEFRGFVEPKGSIRIDRLDKQAHSSDEYIENVTVVWVSSSPQGRTYIIGWYLNAIIYRREIEPAADTQRIFQGNKIFFNVKAKIKGCVLLPLSERTTSVPTGKGGIGQSNMWYADDQQNPDHKKYREATISLIRTYYENNSMKCQCGAIIPITKFTIGKKGCCSKCGETITVEKKDTGTIPEPKVETKKGSTKKSSRKELRKKTKRTPLSDEQVYEYAIKTVVGVQHEAGEGSGVVISPDGLIVTNKHVVYGGHKTAKIKLCDGSLHSAKILKYYRDIDLAFLKINSKTTDFIEINTNAHVKIGQHVLAIGHPLGHEGVLTDGIISKLNQEVNGRKYLQHTASINPGNSGGPILNNYLELVGINTMSRSGAEGMHFAISNESILEKYNSISKKIDYLATNYFCHICGNTSYNTTYCDHCGVFIDKGVGINRNDTDIIKCSGCNGIFDGEITICPNCSSSI